MINCIVCVLGASTNSNRKRKKSGAHFDRISFEFKLNRSNWIYDFWSENFGCGSAIAHSYKSVKFFLFVYDEFVQFVSVQFSSVQFDSVRFISDCEYRYCY